MGKVVKISLGKYSPKEYDLPDLKDCLRHIDNESLMFFGRNTKKNYRTVYGVGTVYKISHGNMFDLVYIKFGATKTIRKIIVADNHARRQILTLKKGHLATFYGYGRVMQHELDSNEKKPHWVLWAMGFQDWYVPRAIEIKKNYSDNEDIEPISDSDEMMVNDILEQFENNGENNND